MKLNVLKKREKSTNLLTKDSNSLGIGPVIATALLLVVSVVTVIGFQGWFQTYSSGLMTDIELQEDLNSMKIETIIGDTLYIKKSGVSNITITKVTIDGFDCNISNYSSNLNLIQLNMSYCIGNITTSVPEIVVHTTSNIIQVSKFVDSSSGLTPSFADCPAIDGTQLNHGQSYSFFNTSFGSTCYSSSRICNNGIVEGNSSYNLSSCTTSLSCTTDTDGDGQILWTCANYPMTNTTYEGDLDVNDNNATIQADMSCLYSGDKDHCESNLIVDGCGTGTVQDIATGLCWQRDMSTAGTMTWEDAKTYCDTTLDGLGGHNDWYLPSRQELFTITDLSRYNPAIIGGNNNKFTNVVLSYYWTSSTYGPSTSSAWNVGFYGGYDGNGYGKTGTYYVVCVRRD